MSIRRPLVALAALAFTAACAQHPAPSPESAPQSDNAQPDRGRPADATSSGHDARSTTLDARDIRDQAVSRVEELFVGRFPGVQVFQTPSGLEVRIRGSSSLLGNGEPLYVVDDMVLTPGTGGLVAINPRDVARIEVLKDAVSLAEFGVRGANGVVRITTKRR
ncbi:MAG TPA: TonB-dependent receptor plug domain-containing protein [Gemmatimonas sp.]|uniref:TonB-dependent receptor plug domain-containing protein n=1 Tax=Gemmatimonas sp. TaxID=1962908 RepID=UPI002ED9FC91